MARRLGVYTLGHYMSLNNSFIKKLWNPLLENYESWELTQLDLDNKDVIDQSIEGMLLTHEQILGGFFPLAERVDCLKRIKYEFQKNFDNLVQILSMEVQKPLPLARIECERCVATLEANIAHGEALKAQEQSLKAQSHSIEGKSLRVPRKLALGISPFNFPLNLCLHKIAPAILAGTPIIWRPSSKGHFTALALVDILHAAKIPAGTLAFLPMNNECFWSLLKDPRIDAVSFTGSAAVGWEIAKNFRGPTLLELGGAAPIYLEKLQGEELKKALSEIASSAYSFAGQSCISAQSLFVQSELFEESRKILQELTLNFATGKTWSENTLCSGVIDEEAKNRIEALLREAAMSSGAKITSAPVKEVPNFVAPTLIENSTENLLREEVFGPLLNLQSVKSFEDFKDFSNKLPCRLQCGVYSNDPQTLEAAKKLDFGGICLNTSTSQRLDALPYGGRGLAGIGMENPSSCYEFFAPYKTFYSPKSSC